MFTLSGRGFNPNLMSNLCSESRQMVGYHFNLPLRSARQIYALVKILCSRQLPSIRWAGTFMLYTKTAYSRMIMVPRGSDSSVRPTAARHGVLLFLSTQPFK